MTVGSVAASADQAIISTAPAVHRPAAGVTTTAGVAPTFNETLRSRTALSSGSADLDAIFDAASRRYNIPSNLLKAVAKVESNFRPDVTSRVGAMGIMQLMPGTAKYLGVDDPFDPAQNIMGGARYLRENLDRFDGDIKLALAAYNAGWPTVKKHGGIPPFRETQAYVPKVLGYFGNDEPSVNDLTYSGFDMGGKISETASNNSTFNFNEALAQMLYIKMIEMQMSSSSSKENTSRVF